MSTSPLFSTPSRTLYVFESIYIDLSFVVSSSSSTFLFLYMILTLLLPGICSFLYLYKTSSAILFINLYRFSSSVLLFSSITLYFIEFVFVATFISSIKINSIFNNNNNNSLYPNLFNTFIILSILLFSINLILYSN